MTCITDPVQSRRGCENLLGFPTTGISDIGLYQLIFLATLCLCPTNVVGYQNRNSVQA